MVATIFAASGFDAGIGKTVWREHDLRDGIGSRWGGEMFLHGDALEICTSNACCRRQSVRRPAPTGWVREKGWVMDGSGRWDASWGREGRQPSIYTVRERQWRRTCDWPAACTVPKERGCVAQKEKVRILAAAMESSPKFPTSMARRLEKRDMHDGSVFVLTPWMLKPEGSRQVSTRAH